jgi:hypothetical protein
MHYVLQWASTFVSVKSKTSNRLCGTRGAASHIWCALNLYCILHTILCEPKLRPQQSNGLSQLLLGHPEQEPQVFVARPLLDDQLLLQSVYQLSVLVFLFLPQ